MTYSPPIASAADFAIDRPSALPAAGAADFDLAAGARLKSITRDVDLSLYPEYRVPAAFGVDFDLADPVGAQLPYSRVPSVIASFGARWNPVPARKPLRRTAGFAAALQRQVTAYVRSQSASDPQAVGLRSPFGASPHKPRRTAGPWADASQRLTARAAGPWLAAPKRDIRDTLRWENASVHLADDTRGPYVAKLPKRDVAKTSPHRSSDVHHQREAPTGIDVPIPTLTTTPGQIALTERVLTQPAGVFRFPAPPERPSRPSIAPTDRRVRGPHIVAPEKDARSRLPWGPGGSRDTTLRFQYPQDPYTPEPEYGLRWPIPIRRIYVVSNSAQIVRVSDGRDVPAQSVQLSTGVDNYGWAMAATLSGKAAMALVEGTDAAPVEVDVTVNGYTWRMLIDGWSLSEAAVQSSGRVTGRGRAAYLAAPYAAPRTYREDSALLVQQLAAQELPPGWTLEWSAADWVVPAAAWEYQGLAPMDAVAKLAAAAGGFLQADRSLETVRVAPRYPAAPWAWAPEIVDFLLPRDVLLQRSSTKKPGQGRNAVWVQGSDILARVLLTGTAGDSLAPTVVEPLLADTAGARARGIAALAGTRRQALESHEMPLSASLGGIIAPGKLVEVGAGKGGSFVGDWIGLVTETTVAAAASRQRGGVALQVRQTIGVERHFED